MTDIKKPTNKKKKEHVVEPMTKRMDFTEFLAQAPHLRPKVKKDK